jgi:AbiJ N-terminal domain 4
MTFSERQGLKPIRQVLQTNSMGAELWNRLWNVLSDRCLHLSEPYLFSNRYNTYLSSFCQTLWHDYFKRPTDTIPYYPNEAIGEIRKYIFNCEWFEVYDLIEFVANRSTYTSPSSAMTGFNEVLASELSAYRFVGGKLAPISSEQEKLSIEHAITQTTDSFSNSSEHLQQAVTLLARKPTPDYRNSIKESISAVEALCVVVTGNSKVTLGQALKVIDTEAPLHGALRSAFEKLYGYTSDADGIRHALMEETKLEQEDAIFMLVACSAFVSYVIAKRARKSSSLS